MKPIIAYREIPCQAECLSEDAVGLNRFTGLDVEQAIAFGVDWLALAENGRADTGDFPLIELFSF